MTNAVTLAIPDLPPARLTRDSAWRWLVVADRLPKSGWSTAKGPETTAAFASPSSAKPALIWHHSCRRLLAGFWLDFRLLNLRPLSCAVSVERIVVDWHE